jgi:hypothetical protein
MKTQAIIANTQAANPQPANISRKEDCMKEEQRILLVCPGGRHAVGDAPAERSTHSVSKSK